MDGVITRLPNLKPTTLTDLEGAKVANTVRELRGRGLLVAPTKFVAIEATGIGGIYFSEHNTVGVSYAAIYEGGDWLLEVVCHELVHALDFAYGLTQQTDTCMLRQAIARSGEPFFDRVLGYWDSDIEVFAHSETLFYVDRSRYENTFGTDELPFSHASRGVR